ncbi:exodeoxyribonuclease VII large subunit [Methylovirgula ligni]|uniref:Exodeoxyribonuclease 7 large subunit n=1 Tax=Methylovirgula ligni TaxID=569860 RepID=A0A3D9YUZ6_9HYPH|nr:exodeoxyribonuclease VII large subunit [Methylovirgula ligni]QAY97305.1 exodeoxyribonuclease VII large subunit [Methylovirgula ligni]REF86400.1 exodeoxyribonuclease VII large subunit [Methylovirgula ligni]
MAKPTTNKPITNAPEFTVGELAGALKRTIEESFGFVRLRGEISNYRGPHSSGHAYFSLKDETARIDAVIWKGTLARLKVKPEEGLEVIASGKVTTYPGKSSYQIVVESLEPAGLGALMALLEERRRKLAAEGLFDEARKQIIPFLPAMIGVVTSPTGAVIRDILHRIADRFPRNVLVWPVRVQGETSAAEVAAAITGFNAMPEPRPDVLIVARGGGSLEDLWSFNEEIVVRAAAASLIPLISAIGHETDWTLLDHAADLRAPTPTGAAEKAVPVRSELLTALADLSRRQGNAALRFLAQRRADWRALARALPRGDALLAIPRQDFDQTSTRLANVMAGVIDRRHIALARLAHRLTSQSPQAKMGRAAQKLDALEHRLRRAAAQTAERGRQRLTQAHLRLGTALAGRARLEAQKVTTARQRLTGLDARLRRAAAAGLERQGQVIESQADRLHQALVAFVGERRQHFVQAHLRLGTALAGRARLEAQKVTTARQRLTGLDARLRRAAASGLERRGQRLAAQTQLLGTLGYRQVLARGFALVRDADGMPLHRAADVADGARLDIEFADGHRSATAGEATKAAPAKAVRARAKPTQGSLF